MAKGRKLKVFRTPIGFHDAYVAASSRKGALEAWGSDADLFARGVAEEVTDEALMREPLERPGEVVRRLRGTAEEQFAALPPDAPRRKKATADEDKSDVERSRATVSSRSRPKTVPPPKPKPRPSRDLLDEAEAALEALDQRQQVKLGTVQERQKALAKERRELERSQARERGAAERHVETLREDHAEALRRWREQQE